MAKEPEAWGPRMLTTSCPHRRVPGRQERGLWPRGRPGPGRPRGTKKGFGSCRRGLALGDRQPDGEAESSPAPLAVLRPSNAGPAECRARGCAEPAFLPAEGPQARTDAEEAQAPFWTHHCSQAGEVS